MWVVTDEGPAKASLRACVEMERLTSLFGGIGEDTDLDAIVEVVESLEYVKLFDICASLEDGREIREFVTLERRLELEGVFQEETGSRDDCREGTSDMDF